MGTLGGNLLLDTRCNYYDQNYEWRKAIDFCMKKDGDDLLGGAGQSPRCWAVQSADSVPLLVAMGARSTWWGRRGTAWCRRYAGTDVVGPIWDRALANSLGPRRDLGRQQTINELEHTLAGHPRRADILHRFHELGPQEARP